MNKTKNCWREKIKNFKGSDLEMVLTALAILLPIGVWLITGILEATSK